MAAQRGEIRLRQEQVDRLLVGVDFLQRIARASDAELPAWETEKAAEIDAFLEELKFVLAADAPPAATAPGPTPVAPPARETKSQPAPLPAIGADATEAKPEPSPPTARQDPRVLRFLADMVGADRIMMGSDMPFPIGDLAPLKIVAETPFSDAERAAINGGLAAKLFGL